MKAQTRLILSTICSAIAGAALLATFAFNETNPGNDLLEVKGEGRLQYKWYAPELPKSISFSGEQVPLDRWEVRERLDREVLTNYYMHGSLLYILKLTTRYFPEIEARLKANGIPEDFKYLCVAESSLQHLTSSAGAQSLWQFLGGTGEQYGLEIDNDVDERYHVEKATDAACRYFRQAYEKFGNWTAAAASYNCGMGGYNSQASFQGSNNFYDIVLPEETNRYIFRILALKYLISGAKAAGYILQPGDTYKPFSTRDVTVAETIPNLAEWAQAQGTSYKYVKLLNPWLRARSLAVKAGKTYAIAVPR